MIRIVHSLGGCGGTLLSRCLGAMPKVALLSEINPLAVHLFEAFNPLYQDSHWLHLLSDGDKQRLSCIDLSRTEGFRDVVDAIYSRSKIADRFLIVRDYNYVEFVGVPFLSRPPMRRTLYDALPRGVLTRGIALVRHPIDQWLSLCKHGDLRSLLKPSDFCESYAAFLEDLRSTPVYKYEDFVLNPEKQLLRICRDLQIPFDPTFKNRFHSFRFVTGDFSRQGEATIALPREVRRSGRILEEFQSIPSFTKILRSLDYAETAETHA